MRYWTIVYPDQNTLGEDYVHWETLSEDDILNHYWDYWCERMYEVDLDNLISKEKCIEDWCIVYWAQRNYWREMKECIQ